MKIEEIWPLPSALWPWQSGSRRLVNVESKRVFDAVRFDLQTDCEQRQSGGSEEVTPTPSRGSKKVRTRVRLMETKLASHDARDETLQPPWINKEYLTPS
ncbi:hypothetical protein PoB_004348100 [Plakobranchus ocellatus]|uniref:Uncharacterized protein n=1 Tax=Plakobranchus ocellatus TaxID=259542 RepID=A0AAV4B0Q0_9GAST|nr:hypothetical protein PoB_004348100 [Plakobranchus ocellatus]